MQSAQKESLQSTNLELQTVEQLQAELSERKRLMDQMVSQIDSLQKKLDRRNTEVRELQKQTVQLCTAVKHVVGPATENLLKLHGNALTCFRNGDLGPLDDTLLSMSTHMNRLRELAELFELHLVERAGIVDKHGQESVASAQKFLQDLRALAKPAPR